MSRVGGTVNVGPTMGGPAGDHACMEAAGLFDAAKWALPEGRDPCVSLYDAGVSHRTQAAAAAAGFKLGLSGIVRKSKNSTLSFAQRTANFRVSSLRIRVENFIGNVKQRFRVLNKPLAMADLGFMDCIFYCCFLLHNFGTPIIH